MKCRVFFAGLFLGAVLISPFGTAVAATEKTCDFRNSLDELELAEGNSFDSLEALRRELTTRKNILMNVLDCAMEDVRTLESNVKATNADETDSGSIQKNLLRETDDVISYYENQRARIKDLGLKGTQDFASSLYEWRRAHYVLLSERTENFMIWNSNQKLFQITQSRLNQVNQTMRILKLIDNEEIQRFFQEAQANFQSAQAMNGRVRDSFREGTDPNESLSFIKLSLEALSKTYQNFFDLSQTVSKILPH